ncbi:MAG: sensor histidine kinase [Planctomycetota bacterium]
MLARWPIFYKLLLGVCLLLLMVGLLVFTGFSGTYAFRHLARSISRRAAEMPRSAELTRSIAELRGVFAPLQPSLDTSLTDLAPQQSLTLARHRLSQKLADVRLAFQRYREQLERNADSNLSIDDDSDEWETVHQIEASLDRLEVLKQDHNGLLKSYGLSAWDEELERIEQLSAALPNHLHQRMFSLLADVRGRYRTWIYLTSFSAITTVVLLIALGVLFWVWIFGPLRQLVAESRRITAGDLHHRIQIDTADEVAELARAINDMTDAFQSIRDHLNEQVKQRTKEVVRSEQLASVGFLAAGVAHEINNPLAAIAMCAESLESRIPDVLSISTDDVAAGALPDEHHARDLAIIQKYLRRIQEEAFRCKGITEKLLDFSRSSTVLREETDLCRVVSDVVEIVETLSDYRDRRVEFIESESVSAWVNPAEIKQVILNLLTNALDSLDPGGRVQVRLTRVGQAAELHVEDNGCGMTEEVLRHLFEPFFTRRRQGRGTGLGMSITYRIIQEHGGTIDVTSAGPGKGSQVRVILPLKMAEQTLDYGRSRGLPLLGAA